MWLCILLRNTFMDMTMSSCYKEDPRTSWGKIVDYMKQLYPEAKDMQIRKILK